MIKKIIITVLVLVVIGGVGAYYYYSDMMEKALPQILNASKEMFIDSCKESADCIRAVNDFYPSCRDKHYPKEIKLSNFQDKIYGEFFNDVHNCISQKSGITLPSIWDHLMRSEIAK